MTQVVAIDTKTAKDILTTLQGLKKEVASLRKSLTEPPYGSREWWEWSERRVDEDIKAGRVVKFDSVKEAITWLNA